MRRFSGISRILLQNQLIMRASFCTQATEKLLTSNLLSIGLVFNSVNQAILSMARSSSDQGQLEQRGARGNQGDRDRRQVKCYNCQRTGHIARNCPEQRRPDRDNGQNRGVQRKQYNQNRQVQRESNDENNRVYERRDNQTKCYNCQQLGHLAKDCKQEKSDDLRCFNCGQKGHVSKECKQPRSCSICRQKGHFARECPQK